MVSVLKFLLVDCFWVWLGVLVVLVFCSCCVLIFGSVVGSGIGRFWFVILWSLVLGICGGYCWMGFIGSGVFCVWYVCCWSVLGWSVLGCFSIWVCSGCIVVIGWLGCFWGCGSFGRLFFWWCGVGRWLVLVLGVGFCGIFSWFWLFFLGCCSWVGLGVLWCWLFGLFFWLGYFVILGVCRVDRLVSRVCWWWCCGWWIVGKLCGWWCFGCLGCFFFWLFCIVCWRSLGCLFGVFLGLVWLWIVLGIVGCVVFGIKGCLVLVDVVLLVRCLLCWWRIGLFCLFLGLCVDWRKFVCLCLVVMFWCGWRRWRFCWWVRFLGCFLYLGLYGWCSWLGLVFWMFVVWCGGEICGWWNCVVLGCWWIVVWELDFRLFGWRIYVFYCVVWIC